MTTDDGSLDFFTVEGSFTEDPIPNDFFGCAGVAEIPGLQDVPPHIGRNGYRHHVSVTRGNLAEVLCEALGYYFALEIDHLQAMVAST